MTLINNIIFFLTALLLFITMLLNSGCMRTYDYTIPPSLSPKLKEIDTFTLDTISQSEPITVEQASSNKIQQCEELKPSVEPTELTLELVRKATLENNLRLKVDLIAPSIAQTRVDEERAKFETVFSGGTSYSDNNSTTDYGVGFEKPLPTGGSLIANLSFNDTGTGSNATTTANAGISFIQPLLRGSRTSINTQSIRISQIERDISDAQIKLRMINLLTNADVAYWQLFAAQKELEVRQEQYKLAENQLDHARKKVASGAAARIEIVRAEAGVASRLEAVINSENNVISQQRSLRRIMNRPGLPLDDDNQMILQTNPNPLGVDLDRDRLVKHALENRMNMIQLDLRLEIDEMNIESAKNRTLPDLALTAEYDLTREAESISDSFENLNNDSSDNSFVGLTFSVPLGNRASKARLYRAQLNQLVHEAEKKDLEQFIRQQVLDAIGALETSWRRILAAEQGVEAAERDYRVEESQFQLGVRTSTDVLQATTRLADAQLARIRAFVDYEIAQISLAHATGTLLGHGKIVIDQIDTDTI